MRCALPAALLFFALASHAAAQEHAATLRVDQVSLSASTSVARTSEATLREAIDRVGSELATCLLPAVPAHTTLHVAGRELAATLVLHFVPATRALRRGVEVTGRGVRGGAVACVERTLEGITAPQEGLTAATLELHAHWEADGDGVPSLAGAAAASGTMSFHVDGDGPNADVARARRAVSTHMAAVRACLSRSRAQHQSIDYTVSYLATGAVESVEAGTAAIPLPTDTCVVDALRLATSPALSRPVHAHLVVEFTAD